MFKGGMEFKNKYIHGKSRDTGSLERVLKMWYPGATTLAEAVDKERALLRPLPKSMEEADLFKDMREAMALDLTLGNHSQNKTPKK